MFPVNFEYPVDIAKAYEEKGRWIVEGYAATSDFDLQSDIITEEAIRASARDLIESSTVLHNHNPDEAVGKVLESKAKKTGLFLKILISKTVPDIWQKVKEGVLNKFSVRGKIIDARKEWVARLKRFVRKILRMRLVEVSLVAVPANPKARAVRWYVEKALEEFEKAGGELKKVSSIENGVSSKEKTKERDSDVCDSIHDTRYSIHGSAAEGGTKGGAEMDGEEDVVVEEELLEASGEPEVSEESEVRNDMEANSEQAGVNSEKQSTSRSALPTSHYPLSTAERSEASYPYPKAPASPTADEAKPAPERGTRMRQIMALVDKLLPGEKDEERKKVLSQIREIARGASYAQPPAKKEEPEEAAKPPQEPSGDAEPDVEKAGRKVSKARLTRLKKLLDELRTFIDEVEVAAPGAADAGKKNAGDTGDDEKVSALEAALADVTKRLEGLENAPGIKTSLDGQEPLPGEKKDKALWKGLV